MHVQVVTYEAGIMGEQEYIDLAHEIAPRIATVPGLMAAVWLDGSQTGTYGGVFFWDDDASMDRFTSGPLFAAMVEQFGDVLVADAGVLENVTRQTQPALQIIPSFTEEPAKTAPGAGQIDRAAPSRKRLTAKATGATAKRSPAKKSARATKPVSAKKKPAASKPSSRKAASATPGTGTRRKAPSGSKSKAKR